MAAEGLENAAKAAGHEMKVETQGSAGSTPLSAAEIAAADAVIFAHDLPVKDAGRFAGKPIVDVGVKKGISDGPALVAEAGADRRAVEGRTRSWRPRRCRPARRCPVAG